MTAATPPTRTKRTRWRRSVAKISAKSVGRRGTAERVHEVDVILEDGQPLGGGEARHPANKGQIHALPSRTRNLLSGTFQRLVHDSDP